jgi:hypothetical protein
MPHYEYKVVPAPQKGQKAKGVKAPEARFALTIEGLMNEMAAEGWEYQRAEMLPSLERSGLTSSTTEWRNLLIFRRLATDTGDFRPELLPAPEEVPMPAKGRPEPQLRKPQGAPVDAGPLVSAEPRRVSAEEAGEKAEKPVDKPTEEGEKTAETSKA